MSDIQQFLPGVLLSLSAITLALMSPGPNILAVIGTSMSVGRKQGVYLGLGVGFGTYLWVTFAVLGFTAFIAKYATVMYGLKILGGLYLIWLGYKALKSAASSKDLSEKAILLTTNFAYFKKGLTVQMMNPKAALANLAIVSIGVHESAPIWVAGSIVIGATILSVSGHVLYAIAFSTKPMIAIYARGRRLIEAALGTVFCFLGVRLLTEKS